ncbi:MAG: hypothetical protein H7326_06110 [Bdellovibrionaceae bacterium]|nr:hypothetical protein [Pseudobdellovibrionaceae bacterium]
MSKWILSLLCWPLLAATPVIVSQSVGQVGDRVVTSREVQISAAIDQALFPQKDKANNFRELHLGDAAMPGEVTAVLLEVVVHREADNFSVAKITEEQIVESSRKVERTLESKTYWQNLEVSSAEVKKFVAQKLTAKAFIQFKTNSMAGVVSESEALAYYEKNRLKFGELPFTSFKENIKTFLAQQQLEDRTRAWFEIIKRKYKVRNVLAENMNNKVGPK